MTARTSIAVLTGGGDVPGLNAVIKSVVYRATEMGRNVIGIRKGWKGLTHLNPAEKFDATYARELTRENTRTIDRTGGTVLHTSRTNPRRVAINKVPEHLSSAQLGKLPTDGKSYDFTPIVLENLERLGVGCLIAIGGDDTLSFAAALSSHGFPVIGVPKTMDNDVRGTEYCIGILHGNHPREGLHHPPAHHAGLARTHRNISHFRPRFRIHGTLHRLRNFHSLPDSGIPVRSGPRQQAARGRQT